MMEDCDNGMMILLLMMTMVMMVVTLIPVTRIISFIGLSKLFSSVTALKNKYTLTPSKVSVRQVAYTSHMYGQN